MRHLRKLMLEPIDRMAASSYIVGKRIERIKAITAELDAGHVVLIQAGTVVHDFGPTDDPVVAHAVACKAEEYLWHLPDAVLRAV